MNKPICFGMMNCNIFTFSQCGFSKECLIESKLIHKENVETPIHEQFGSFSD